MRSPRLSIAALLFGLACAPAIRPEFEPVAPRGDAKSLTAADLVDATQLNLLDFISAERPHWLRSPDGRAGALIVYLGDARLGGAATLRGLTLHTVGSVRYYEASAAQQRFSPRDYGPVIHVLLK